MLLPVRTGYSRAEAWAYGVQLREALIQEWMKRHGAVVRPWFKHVIDDLIEEIAGARLISGPLPLNRFAQTEVVDGRPEVTINTRISEIGGVKHAEGIALVAKSHELIHVALDCDQATVEPDEDWFQPELHHERLILCRGVPEGGERGTPRERFAEWAGLAASMVGADLARCKPFDQLRGMIRRGEPINELEVGWQLLFQTAEQLGVNITALSRFLQQAEIIQIENDHGVERLMAHPAVKGGVAWPQIG